MIDLERINITITKGLKSAAGCKVMKANLVRETILECPYILYNILSTETKKGACLAENGRRYMPLIQTWNFAALGDQDNEAELAAIKSKIWLEELGRNELNNAGIVVQSVGPVMNRDTLLTNGYEYRKEFEAVLSVMHVIEGQIDETIDMAQIKEE